MPTVFSSTKIVQTTVHLIESQELLFHPYAVVHCSHDAWQKSIVNSPAPTRVYMTSATPSTLYSDPVGLWSMYRYAPMSSYQWRAFRGHDGLATSSALLGFRRCQFAKCSRSSIQFLPMSDGYNQKPCSHIHTVKKQIQMSHLGSPWFFTLV